MLDCIWVTSMSGITMNFYVHVTEDERLKELKKP